MPPEGCTGAAILPGCPNLDRGSRGAEVGLEPRTFRTLSVPSCRATRRRHEGWDTARSPKPRKGKSRSRGRVGTKDISVTNITAVQPLEAKRSTAEQETVMQSTNGRPCSSFSWDESTQ
ncbi:hypothetical protein T265_05351 [Opisthorchis viverrini]|uniref:Uncharacterized protein n=1 Tax=Opisthorchis viverrini TaxID=6198 RepID=A0A074ZP92_OPIVI|nr:hypothetical protein T265_05351 [Opisthorchis viverrini]KER27632.1 hypothetical protein T265_05351 [Opisthorchis viverrini]